MKLIAASTALFATLQAQSIDTLVGELIDQIYQVSPDGKTYTINAAPYLQSTHTCLGNGWIGESLVGNGNGVLKINDEARFVDGELDYTLSCSGTAKSHPLAAIFPDEVLNDEIDATYKIHGSSEGVSADNSGTVNNIPWSIKAEFNMDSFTMSSKKYTIEMSANRNIDIPNSIHEYWRVLFPNGESDITLAASARRICGENPLDKSCSAKVTITGSDNGNDFGKNTAKYTVSNKKAQLSVTHNKNELFWLGLVGIDTMEVLALKYKLNGGKAVLIIQAFGPEGFDAVATAGIEFSAPFDAFINGIHDGNQAAHVVAYADKVCAHIQGKSYFNLYPIFRATQLESDLIANAMGLSSLQSAAKKGCATLNKNIEDSAVELGPMVEIARMYVNEVTSAAGENQFDSWFAGLKEN